MALRKKRIIAAALAGLLLTGQASPPGSINARMTGDIAPAHDPTIIREGEWFYVLTTVSSVNEPPGILHIRRSKDLVTWEKTGAVFNALPQWAKDKVPGTKGLWAPDISRSGGGEYRVYYSVSTFGSNTSAIGLATSETLDPASPDYGWTDKGLVYASNARSDHNAIDPNVFTDSDGRQWMSFGSFWTGLKMFELDPTTGKAKSPAPEMIAIARRPTPGAVEAPVIVARGGFYYLFASYDSCCRGAKSTYYTVVGRSKAVTGPYIDAKGRRMLDGGGEVVLHARLDKSGRWAGPGHPAVLMQGDRAIIVYHAYDKRNNGTPTLRIQPLGFDKDGWPVAL